MAFTEDTADDIINKLLRNTNWSHAAAHYVGLHTADPGQNGANENSAYDGNRKAVTFDAPSSGTSTNAGALTFANMPAITVTHISIWDAATGGNFLWGQALTASKAVDAADSFVLAVGDVDVDLTLSAA